MAKESMREKNRRKRQTGEEENKTKQSHESHRKMKITSTEFPEGRYTISEKDSVAS